MSEGIDWAGVVDNVLGEGTEGERNYGDPVSEPGRYHVIVDDLKVFEGYRIAKMTILAGDPAGQAGKKIDEFLHRSAGAVARSLRFALACGLTTRELLLEAKANDSPPLVDYEAAVGKSICVGVVYGKGKYAEKLAVGFADFWALDDPNAADIPKAFDKAECKSIVESRPAPQAEHANTGPGNDIPF